MEQECIPYEWVSLISAKIRPSATIATLTSSTDIVLSIMLVLQMMPRPWKRGILARSIKFNYLRQSFNFLTAFSDDEMS